VSPVKHTHSLGALPVHHRTLPLWCVNEWCHFLVSLYNRPHLASESTV